MSDGQNIAAVRQDTINHTVASFIDLPDIVMLILLHHPTGEWMLGKRIGTACQPVNEALRILRLVFSDVIMKLLQTVAGFDRPVCCHSGKPNCLRTVALSIVRPASLSLRPSSISCSTDTLSP